jgi:hypothetical protein
MHNNNLIIILILSKQFIFRMLLIIDKCIVNWTFCYMCLEGALVVRLQHQAETNLNALSNHYTLE